MGKAADTGRWRSEDDFPKDPTFTSSLIEIRVLYADFAAFTTGVNVANRSGDEQNKTLDLKE